MTVKIFNNTTKGVSEDILFERRCFITDKLFQNIRNEGKLPVFQVFQ